MFAALFVLRDMQRFQKAELTFKVIRGH